MMVVKRAEVPAVLERHGIPSDADAETLCRVITTHGWRVTVEETIVRGGRRATAQATRLRDVGADPGRAVFREVVRATGRTPGDALAFVLAKALERES